MSVNKNQSAIKEVRDQLSLDFADGEYLNVVSRNLGMDRPIIGFSDDVWRALVKQLALGYKQITTQFHKMLEIVFGVQVTQVGSPAEAIAVGDNKFIINDSSNFPQVGTFVFDEGLATEETHDYCFIDRSTNTVYLDGTTFAFAHDAREADAESEILTYSGTSVVVANASNFPETSFPYPVVLGRGTDSEEVVEVTACDRDTGVITLSGAPSNSHEGVVPTEIRDDLAQELYLPTSFVELDDSSAFPASGTIRLRPTTTFTVVGDVTPNTNTTITVAADTFVPDSLVGFELVMDTDANTTPATSVVGRRRRIIANTATTITVDEDWTGLGNAPENNDTFFVFPIVDYVSNDETTGILNLRENLDLDTSVTSWVIPNNSIVELMETKATAAFAPVKSPGQGWDVIQSSPGNVELFIPSSLATVNDLRSASYLHTSYDSTDPDTTLSANVSAGAETLPIAVELDFPVSGTVNIDSTELVAYVFPVSTLATDAAESATSLVFEDTSLFGSTGTIIMNPGSGFEENVTFTANNTTTNTLTVSAISTAQNAGTVGVVRTNLVLSRPLTNSFSSGDTVALFDPPHSGTDVIIGDPNLQFDTWQGPYVYDGLSPAPTGATTAPTTLDEIVPGRLTVAASQSAGASSIEVEDALPLLGLPSIDVIVGLNKGVAETATVQEVSLRNRTSTTTTANININDTTIAITSFGPGGADGDTFPNTDGYRIIVDEGGTPEVFLVTGRVGSSFVVASPATIAHSSGVTVRLVKDVLRLDSPLTNFHVGGVSISDRATATEAATGRAAFPVILSSQAEIVAPLIDSITLDSASGLDISGGRVLLNFGYANIPVESTLSVPISDTADVGSTTTVIELVTGGLTPSAHVGQTVLINGEYREITANTAAQLTITPALSSAPSATDVVQIVTVPAGDTTLTVADGSVFPSSGPFIVTVGRGRRYAENVLVTSRTGNDLTLGGGTYGIAFDHAAGDVVYFAPGAPETVTYDEISSNDLSFDSPTMLNYTHYPVEPVVDSSADSDPRDTGYDYPFRMPDELLTRLEYLLDTIRAAGIQATLLFKK